MKRKIISNSSHYRHHVAPGSSCRELVWIDSTPIKASEQRKCQEVYKKLEAARMRIESHESISVPEYRKWLHLCFDKELVEIRKLSEKAAEQREIVNAVFSESMLTGCSTRQAYEKVMRAKSRFEKAEQEFKSKRESSQKSYQESDEDAREDLREDLYEEEVLRSSFEMLFGTKKQWKSRNYSYEEAFQEFKKNSREEYDDDFQFGSGESSDESGGAESRSRKKSKNQSGNKSRNSKNSREESGHDDSDGEGPFGLDRKTPRSAQNQDARIKELYRNLARRLHPDLNPELEPRKIALWHQVQEAYIAGHLERLETLSSLSNLFDSTWDPFEAVTTLKNLFTELVSSLKALEKRLRLAKKDIAWKFHEKLQDPFSLRALEVKMRKELFHAHEDLLREQLELDAMIQEWSAPRTRKKSPERGSRKKGRGRGKGFESDSDSFESFFFGRR